MSDILKTYKVFTPDNYEKEEQYLREMSLKGWHFKKLSFIRYTFVKGEPKSYSYRLDLRKDIKTDKENYLTVHADLGWEHIFQFSAVFSTWEYFRKESQTGEEESLFSDTESKLDLLWRIKNIYIGIMFFMIGINLINFANMFRFISAGEPGGIAFIIMWILIIALYLKIQLGINKKIEKLKK